MKLTKWESADEVGINLISLEELFVWGTYKAFVALKLNIIDGELRGQCVRQ